MTLANEISPERMNTRISRYKTLQRLAVQNDQEIPRAALDVIYARELLPVISPEVGDSPIASAAQIRGAGGITMTIARCPPGQGPSLHLHKTTYETFTVLLGEFEMIYGNEGQHRTVLTLFDTISIPPMVMRTFRNVGQGDGMLQVVVSGGSSFHDIDVSPEAAQQLSELSPKLLTKQLESGVTFNAGRAE